jgi:hypothetical protein
VASTYLLGYVNKTGLTEDDDKTRRAVLSAISALVPSEVIAAATAVAGFLTTTDNGSTSWGDNQGLARILAAVLGVVGIPLVYTLGTGSSPNRKWEITAGLVVLSMLSFAVWLGIQAPSVYDGWHNFTINQMFAISVVYGVPAGIIAAWLGTRPS